MTPNSSPKSQANTIKPVYQCRWCETTFSRRDHRQRHERAHTKERPFLCHLCNASFGRRDILQRHCIHVHGALASDEKDEFNCGVRLKHPAARPAKRRRLSDATDALPSQSFAAEGPLPTDPATIDGQLIHIARRADFPDKLDPLEKLSQISPGTADLDTNIWSMLCEHFGLPKSLQKATVSGHAKTILEPLPTELFPRHSTGRAFGTSSGFTPRPLNFMQGSRPRHLVDSPHIRIPRSIGGGIDFALQQIDTGLILTNYASHIAPSLPMLHLPTIDLSPWVKHGHPKCDGCCLHNGAVLPARRRVNRCLMISLLTLGAICDRRHALAERLFRESGRAIQEYLTEIRLNRSNEPPPIDLIQSMSFYIAYGLCSGSKQIEESMLGHMSCLGSLVQEARLSKPMLKSIYGQAKPDTDDDWLIWAAEEERKRTYFSVLVCMSSAVNYLNIQPYLSSNGIEWALPADEDLFEAKTAASWREMRQRASEPPQFTDELALLFVRPDLPFHADADCLTANISEQAELMSNEGGFLTPQTVTDITTSHKLPSQYGCLVLIAALNVMVWERAHGRSFTFGLSAGGQVPNPSSIITKNSLSSALEQWQKMWISYPKHYSHEDARYRILATCVPLLDHAELLLHVDIAQAKDAMFSRDYQMTSMAYSTLPEVVDDDGMSHSESDTDSPGYEEVHSDEEQCHGLRRAATHAVKALELAFRLGPWWSSEDACFDAPIQSLTAMFHCTQVVSSWLLAFSAKSHQSLRVTSTHKVDHIKDIALLRAIKQLISHRNQTSRPLEESMETAFSIESLDEGNILQLAVGLITTHVQLLRRVSFWPTASHLIEALEARTDAIQNMLTIIRTSKPDHQKQSFLSFSQLEEGDSDIEGWSLHTPIEPCVG